MNFAWNGSIPIAVQLGPQQPLLILGPNHVARAVSEQCQPHYDVDWVDNMCFSVQSPAADIRWLHNDTVRTCYFSNGVVPR